jgi:23S rRNA pseudouridine1911/1915/1917 synthase
MTVPGALAGERLDRVVSLLTGLPRTEAAALVAAGQVARDGQVILTGSRKLAEGDELELDMPAAAVAPATQPDPAVLVEVVYADKDVVVVDKPAGLIVHPGSGHLDGTLVNGLLARFPDLVDGDWPDPTRPGIVHRLDKGTSGLLMVGRTPAALVSLSGQLQARTVDRQYLVLVWGSVEAPAGVIDAPLGRSERDPTRITVRSDGRRAVTHYEVIERFTEPAAVTLLACRLETGRTHQIRVHLAAIGHPVVGDDRYKGGSSRRGGRIVVGGLRAGRPFLHAHTLGFDHPATGERCSFVAPLAADLQAAKSQLR